MFLLTGSSSLQYHQAAQHSSDGLLRQTVMVVNQGDNRPLIQAALAEASQAVRDVNNGLG